MTSGTSQAVSDQHLIVTLFPC